jgi:hypothetical protein
VPLTVVCLIHIVGETATSIEHRARMSQRREDHFPFAHDLSAPTATAGSCGQANVAGARRAYQPPRLEVFALREVVGNSTGIGPPDSHWGFDSPIS